MNQIKLMQGDNMLSLKKLPDNSIDSIVTDPPYGLSFMGKKWDYDVPSIELWKECFRVLKPGGHVLSFGGTRTYHRMVVNIEDAGFEIRDQIMWIYGSGFPKSHNIGKSIEKINVGGKDNLKVIGEKKGLNNESGTKGFSYTKEYIPGVSIGGKQIQGTIPVYEINNEYEGWGTALKPANEPICVARKPLSEKTIATNVIKWGVGGINVDGCRVGTDKIKTTSNNGPGNNGIYGSYNGCDDSIEREGRFPANIIFDKSAADMLDEQSGVSKSSERIGKPGGKTFGGSDMSDEVVGKWFGDKGGASRFFKVIDEEPTPHNEPICVARKPLSEKTIATNVIKWGTGGINVDGCRISFDMNDTNPATNPLYRQQNDYKMPEKGVESEGAVSFTSSKNEINTEGRFPANIIFDESAADMLDEQTGILESGKMFAGQKTKGYEGPCMGKFSPSKTTADTYGDKGGASRFFYVAKVSKKERNMGLDSFEEKENPNATFGFMDDEGIINNGRNPENRSRVMKNNHPTLKPINLMTYLCRLVTPPNGIVLDPFMGSGSTGISALLEGFRFVGMEMDEDYFKICESRIDNYEQYRTLLKK
jgi:DNA modification methylase